MSVTHDQPLAILITAILVELDVVHYLVFDRCLQQLARSFLEQLFEKRLLFIFSSLIERDHFTPWHWRILSFWRPRVRPPGFFFVTERMRLFSAPHPQLSVITPGMRQRAICCRPWRGTLSPFRALHGVPMGRC